MKQKEISFTVTETIPRWAKFIVQDRDGSVWVYEEQPKLEHLYPTLLSVITLRTTLTGN